MTIAQALRAAIEKLISAHIENPQLEAEILLAHVLKKDRIRLHFHAELPLEDSVSEEFKALVARKALHEPTAYILGQWEFWSLPFSVTRDTLIPRPETEMIVEIVLGIVKRKGLDKPLILDLGTGCGVLGVTLAHEIPGATVVATDLSFPALITTRQNARRNGVESRVCLIQADWTHPFRSYGAGFAGFQLVVSNPPYISNKAKKLIAQEISEYEPEKSLFCNDDGLEHIAELINTVPGILCKKAWFICEIGWDQGKRALQMTMDTGKYREAEIRKDLSGKDRVLLARRD